MNRLFEWIVDHPYISIAIVLLITAGLSALIPRLQTETDFQEFISKDDPVMQAMDRAEERYGRTLGIAVMVENDEGIFNTATLSKIQRMEEAIERLPEVEEVTSPLTAQVITGTQTSLSVGAAAPDGKVPETAEEMAAFRDRALGSRLVRDYIVSSNGKAGAISIDLVVGADELAVTREIERIIEENDAPPDRITMYGDAYADAIVAEEMNRDFGILLPLAIVMIIGVLFISFRCLYGVLLPLSVVVLSVLIALGAMVLLGFPVTMISFILPVLLLAIGVADGIHVLNRYHEEAAKGLPKRETIINTMKEMTSPVVMTSLTTAAGFLSLLSSVFIPQKHFGVIAALGVLVAMVLSLVLIPAVLALLKVPRGKRLDKKSGPLSRVLVGFERLVIRYRRGVLIGAVVISVAMLAGLPLLRVETSNEEFLGKDHPVIAILDSIDRNFSGSAQIMIEIDTNTRDGLKDPELLTKMVELEEFLKTQGIRKTLSLAGLVRDMNQKFHADDPAYYVIPEKRGLVSQLLLLFTFQGGDLGNMALGDFSAGTVMGLYKMEGTSEATRLANNVEAYLNTHFGDSAQTNLVGMTMLMSHLMSRLTNSQLLSLVTSMGAVGLIVMLLMGSVVAGLIGLIPLVLTMAVNFGIMAYSGTALDISTLMVSSIAIGIGVDYSIHFLSRFRREYRTHRHAEKSLQTTIQTTGRGITYNALTVALGFVILLFASFKGVRSFGSLIAVTMVVSALSAITVIPAILIHWRPKFLLRSAWGKRETYIIRTAHCGAKPEPARDVSRLEETSSKKL